MAKVVKLITELTFPPVLSLVILAVAAMAFLFRHRRAAAGLALFAFAWSGIWSLPVASDWLRGLLENRYPAVETSALPKSGAIVVLGGATKFTWIDDPNVEASDLKHSRVGAGARAWLAGKAPVIILSGGRGEARLMAAVMPKLDVPASALVLEETSRDTMQNARYTAEIIRKRGWSDNVILVTSAIHMPRAMHAFRQAGLNPVPFSVSEDWYVERGVRGWLPSGIALWRSGRAFKELLGLIESHVKPA